MSTSPLMKLPLAFTLSQACLFAVICGIMACSNRDESTRAITAAPGVATELEQRREPVAASWNVFRGSPDLAGVVDAKIELPMELLWEHQAEDPVLASPVSDGQNVYIGDGDGNFLCLALDDGSEQWRAKTDGTFEGAACLIGDRVVVGSTDGFVRAYEKESGREVWKFETLGEIVGGINTFNRKSPDGEIPCVVFGSHDNKLYCVDARDGAEQWSVETGYYVNGTPCVSDNKIAFGGCDGFIYINDAQSGAEVAKIEIESYISNSIIIKDGIAYVAHYENRVEAFDIGDGKKIWSFQGREFPYFASPAVTATAVIAPGQGKRIYAIDRKTGEEIWDFRSAGRIDGSPIVADGHVIFGADDGILYFLDEKTGEEAWRYEIGDEIKSSPAIVGDTLIIGASDGRVYAFKIPQNAGSTEE